VDAIYKDAAEAAATRMEISGCTRDHDFSGMDCPLHVCESRYQKEIKTVSETSGSHWRTFLAILITTSLPVNGLSVRDQVPVQNERWGTSRAKKINMALC
jgi:hypothetical protein